VHTLFGSPLDLQAGAEQQLGSSAIMPLTGSANDAGHLTCTNCTSTLTDREA
jgi:hypothetical protein